MPRKPDPTSNRSLPMTQKPDKSPTSSLSDLKSNSDFMDGLRLTSEVSLPDRLLKFRLRRKNREKSSSLSPLLIRKSYASRRENH